jgi:tRNA A-37 threonylcarbamoyl transferase component Bud32
VPNVRVQRCAAVLPVPGRDSAPTAEDWADALASFNPSEAQLLKQDSGTAVYRTTMLALAVVIKRWDLTGPAARLKSLLGASRAHRHWRGADRLLKNNISTAQPYVLARSGRAQWLVMQALEGKTLLEHMRDQDLSVKQSHALARDIGRQLADFDLAMVYNRDHKPSNLIVVGDQAQRSVAVIDTVAIRKGLDHARMMASLLIEPTGCQLRVRSALAMRVLRSYYDERKTARASDDDTPRRMREYRSYTWKQVRRLIARHGDPTPRVDPLRQPDAPPVRFP